MKFDNIKKGLLSSVEKILEDPLLISFSVLVFVGALVIFISMPMYLADSHNFLINILSELHGMIFDLLVIGILITWLNMVGQRRRDIRSYKDEIDDFRMWESEESAYRTVGNIKRLNRYKIYDIDLVSCFLSRTNLSYVTLKGANLNNANASNSTLVDINLEVARLNRTNFENSNLNQSNLQGAYASGTNFKDAYMIKANLLNAFLIKADFKNAFLMEANLRGANLTSANLDNANLYKADLRETVGVATIEQLSGVRTLYLAKFDESVLKELRIKHPALLGR